MFLMSRYLEHVGIYLQCERHLSLPSTKKKLQSFVGDFLFGQPHIKHLCCSDPFTEAASFVWEEQGKALQQVQLPCKLFSGHYVIYQGYWVL